MAKKKSTSKTEESNAKPEIENKEELVNFVANNILNSITLNQVVTLVQQVSLRDAGTIVEQADEAKLKEIKTAFVEAVQQAQVAEQAQQSTQAAPEAPEPVPA
jgi:hypothetical protein